MLPCGVTVCGRKRRERVRRRDQLHEAPVRKTLDRDVGKIPADRRHVERAGERALRLKDEFECLPRSPLVVDVGSGADPAKDGA